MGSREIGLRLRFAGCSNVVSPDDVGTLALAFAQHGFVPADGVARNIHPAKDILSMVAAHTVKYSAGSKAAWSVGFPLLLESSDAIVPIFDSHNVGDGVPFIGIAELFEAKYADELEPFVQRLLSLAMDLYPLVKPALGWINAFNTSDTPVGDVKKVRLRTVSWANFFGPPYVARYGKDFLASIPGHKSQELADGGVFHQLSPTFLVSDASSAAALRRSVRNHFAGGNLKVTCQAPFVRSRVFGEQTSPVSEEYGTVEEFRSGLCELLRTTLVLQDGSRVKVLVLDWASLPAEHRRVAMATAWQFAQAELVEHPGAAVRFELNEIPPDLRAGLDEIRQSNPRFSYEKVNFATPA